MLVECITKLGEYRAVQALRAFLHSAFFPLSVVVLMVLGNLFSLELPVFYLYLLLGFTAILFDDDLKPVVPIVICSYLTLSPRNNPAVHSTINGHGWEPSVFYDPAFVLQLSFILAVAAVLIIGRLAVIFMRGEKKKLPMLAFGFAALGIAYLLAGLFSNYYGFRTVLFGFTEIAALCGLYFLFYYGIDWANTKKEEFALLLTLVGCGVVFEVFGMYLQPISAGSKTTIIEEMLSGKYVDRGLLITGWGMYNNVGCVLAMCAPAPFLLATKKKHGWLYVIAAFFIFAGLVLSQSRGSMLFGGVVFLTAIVLMAVFGKGSPRIKNAVTVGAFALAAIVAVVSALCIPALREKVLGIFNSVFSAGFGNNGRFEIYESGIDYFKRYPFFGAGWYGVDFSVVDRWGELPESAFLPPRYHDTYIQLLASGGIFALACYLLHRAETLVMFFRKPSLTKTFLFLSVAALILTSVTDCHFFNLGPGLIYGMLLVYAECGKEDEAADSEALPAAEAIPEQT